MIPDLWYRGPPQPTAGLLRMTDAVIGTAFLHVFPWKDIMGSIGCSCRCGGGGGGGAHSAPLPMKIITHRAPRTDHRSPLHDLKVSRQIDSCSVYNLRSSRCRWEPYRNMFHRLDLYDTDPAHHLITAG